MRTTICTFFILISTCLLAIAGDDTIRFSIDMGRYEKVAIQKQDNIYNRDKNITPENIKSNYTIVSVPIFSLKAEAIKYKCGDDIGALIDFKEDPYFQDVFIYNKEGIYVDGNEIHDTYEKFSIEKYGDIGEVPVLFDYDKAKRRILKYKQRKGAFIFMVKHLRGFWSIRNGVLYKLTNTFHEKNANEYAAKYYGEEFIREMSLGEGMRIGHYYHGCIMPTVQIQPAKKFKIEEKRRE